MKRNKLMGSIGEVIMSAEKQAMLTDPYTVRSGDTLSQIARACGRSIADLKRFNHITDVNKLRTGQTLYLSEATAFGISVLFLDALRHPIANLPYRIEFDGQSVQGKTDTSGAIFNLITRNAASRIDIWIRNAEQQWQCIFNTVSDCGHKLITAVSPYVVVPGQTEKLPPGAPPRPQPPPPPPTPPLPRPAQALPPQAASGAPSSNNPAVRTQTRRGPDGQSILSIGVELPEGLMQLFQSYTGQPLTEIDWERAAGDLGCEVAVLKAIARVESRGAGFWRLNSNAHSGIVPAILYERHYFHRLTCANGPRMNTRERRYHGIGVPGCHSPHDRFIDLSFPHGFVSRLDRHGQPTLGSANRRMPGGVVETADQYGDNATSYLRLVNAYRLDPEAALKSCSWGMFQIMGDEHFGSCGLPLAEFMGKMCSGERGQLDLLGNFIKYKARGLLLAAVRAKDWAKIAYYYNGPGYAENRYDIKIREAYEAIKRSA